MYNLNPLYSNIFSLWHQNLSYWEIWFDLFWVHKSEFGLDWLFSSQDNFFVICFPSLR
jgi:hypothetical protein